MGIDTAPIIYFIEKGIYFKIMRSFFERLLEGHFRAITSTITLLEVLVQPYRYENNHLLEEYKEILLYADSLSIVPVSNEIADKAAELRAKYRVRTPDAIQVATAIHGEASIFLTNDKTLKKIREIEVVTLLDMK
ncbi:MAG: PIN domain-containing protein [Theionarchaea archaeon]|nr:PIN domain-containing protein [Theionarchaea archaeon]